MSKLSYFQNVNSAMSPALIAEIHRVVEENKMYAVAIWKSRADDALDATLVQALKYYSYEKGDLRNYIVATMKNILTNSLKREVSVDDETLHYHVDTTNPEIIMGSEYIEDELLDFESYEESVVQDCVQDFMPYVVEDYKFFSTLENPTFVKEYDEILATHSPKTVLSALNYIKDKGIIGLKDFMDEEAIKGTFSTVNRQGLPLEGIIQSYSSPTLKVVDFIGKTVIVQSRNKPNSTSVSGGSVARPIYELSLRFLATHCFKLIYKSAPYVVDFNDSKYYRLPNGVIVKDDTQLVIQALQEEIAYLLGKKLNYIFLGNVNDSYYILGRSSRVEVSLLGNSFVFELPRVNKKEV